jgi:hypothetical protein
MKWLPGRKVLVSTDWIQDVRWTDRSVKVELTKDVIKSGPEYTPDQIISSEFEDEKSLLQISLIVILKTEKFQYCKFNSLTNLNVVSKVDDYMRHYNEERIQEKIGCHHSKRIWNDGSTKSGVLYVSHFAR